MNGKSIGAVEESPLEGGVHLNPFIHRLELTSTYEKLKTAFFTVAVLPLRVAAICGLLVVAWCIACVGLYGVSDEDLRTKPMAGWRKKLRLITAFLVRGLFAIGGFHWVTVKGVRAAPRDAPILVLAPHSSFVDALVIAYLGAPSIVAKAEANLVPFIGKLINYTQPVYVWRDDADSRQSTVREITRRANSELDWPQILIFPEGTCTNRSCLITFKCGAFYPGVPVQPVCIRYPNKLDTVTWTWEGPGALKLLWLTLTQIHSNCEIEFLPVYRPNAEEKENPKLFANNVRKVMAKALGIPVANFTYNHGRLISTAQRLRLPWGSSLVEMQRLRECLGLDKSAMDEAFLKWPVDKTPVTLDKFGERLQVSAQNPILCELFILCDTESRGQIEWPEYLLALIVITSKGNLLQILRDSLSIYSEGGHGKVSQTVWVTVTGRILGWTAEKSNAVFGALTSSDNGFIAFEDFLKYAETSDDLRSLVREERRMRLKAE